MGKISKKTTNKQAESAIKRNAPAEAKWLTQPTNITFIKGDMTLNQVNTMIEIVDALQERITYALSNKVKSVFADKDYDAEGKVVVTVPFASMTDDARRYQYYESVARSLAETSVTIEKVGDDGKPYTSIKPIINEARIPITDYGYREGNIEFIIEKDMIETLFDINRYNRYIKSVAKNSRSVYTSRIYQFITAYKSIGVWRPRYEELHLMFGLSEYRIDKETKTKEWVPKKYNDYRQFKQKILKVAHDELKELADSGEVDCFFEFSEEYPPGKKMGKPERIRFDIKTTAYGTEHDKVMELSRQQIEIEKLLKELGCTATDMKQIKSLINADNADFCIEKINEVRAYIDAHKDKIDNAKKYAISSIRNALAELIPQAEEVVVPDTPPTDTPAVTTTHVIMDDEMAALRKEYKDDERMSMVLSAISIEMDDGVKYIKVPSQAFVDTFAKEISVLTDRVGVGKLRVN